METTGHATEAGGTGPAAEAREPGRPGLPDLAGLAEAPGLLGTLDEAMLPADPMDLFEAWLGDVIRAGLPEPTAMVLSTVSADRRPRARMVLLKGADVTGFTFYTNRTSRKASDLAEVPLACLQFPWQALHRQVIVEGPVTPLSSAESEPYFHQPAAWFPARRLGQQAVHGAVVAGRTRGSLRRTGAALAGGNAGADARFLGRLPAAP